MKIPPTRLISTPLADHRRTLQLRPEPIRIDGSVRLGPILRRNRWMGLAILLVSILIGGLASLLQTPLYRATTVIEVQSINPEFLKNKELDPNSSSGSLEIYAATAAKLLRTDALAQRVVAASRLNTRPEFFQYSGTWARILGALGLPVSDQARGERATAEKLKDRITVRTDSDSSLLTVSVDAPERGLAAELTRLLTEEFELQEQESRWNMSVRVGDWLTNQLEDFRKRLEISGQNLQKYADSAHLLYTKDGQSVAEERLRQIQQEFSQAQADRVTKQVQMNLASTSPPESLPRVLDDDPIRAYKMKLADLKRSLADLDVTLTPAHYKVESVNAQIMAIESAIEQERANILARIQNEYNTSLQREQLLSRGYDGQARVVTDESVRAVRYDTLRKEMESNQELYRSMLQKVKEASVLSAIHTSTFRVVDPAQPPDHVDSPKYLKNAGFGLLSGMILSGLMMLVRERNNTTIRRPGEISSLLKIRELGVIPSLQNDPRYALVKQAASERLPEDYERPTLSQTRSVVAEAFRCTAASLLFADKTQQQGKVFLVTSPHAGEGKTTTAASLATALSLGNRKVIVIDCDLRKPRLHELLGTQNLKGLSNLLGSTHPLAASEIQNSLTVTPIRGVTALTGGTITKIDPSVLESERLAKIFIHLRRNFDLVLVDSPPALQISDARVLARLCDAVILVGRAGQTKMEDFSEALQTLSEDGSRVVGSILTGWDPRSENPNYFNSYYRQYT